MNPSVVPPGPGGLGPDSGAAAPALRVAVMITCVADLFRPTVGFATVRLLEQAGCRVVVPPNQTCCGQPAFNSGDRARAQAQARHTLGVFADLDVDHIVAPSGSCAGMVRCQYPDLLADDPRWADTARKLADRTHELTAFLVDVLGWDGITARFDGIVTYHDSCSGLRELGIHDQPRRLLSRVAGLTLVDLAQPEECCGFGGTFAVKHPQISARMVDTKVQDIEATGAGTVLGGDTSCLLNIAGRLRRRGSAVAVRHVAEVLAGLADGPALGADPQPASPAHQNRDDGCGCGNGGTCGGGDGGGHQTTFPRSGNSTGCGCGGACGEAVTPPRKDDDRTDPAPPTTRGALGGPGTGS